MDRRYPRPPNRSPARAAACALALLLPAGAAGAASAAGRVDFFEKRIRPVLARHCYRCHSAGAKKLRAGLLLDSRDGLRRGGDSGPAVVPGDPAASLLFRALRYEEYQMPPAGKLPARVVADFKTWIRQGAAYPRIPAAPAAEVRQAHAAARPPIWAFQPPRRHDAPAVRDRDWPRRKIDRFLLARLERAGLAPSPPADRRTLLRRVSFDLVGLPPTPGEIAAFLGDRKPDAEERVVARLLASPRYGERWARVWLDVARYAEDQAHIVGDDRSLCYPNAYLYRDWVIRALNADMPYARFVRLQLAADLIGPDEPRQTGLGPTPLETGPDLPALGFLGLGPKYYDRRSPAVMADEWEDRVDVVGRGLLGLTVACARCHDHKFDPIPTADYYALAGVFASTAMFNRPLDGRRPTKPDGQAKQPQDALHIVREGRPVDLCVAVRGDVNTRGPVVPRRFLRVLCAGEPPPFRRGSGRRELADAVADRGNPLTARVIVNRVWDQLFGRPLVGTPSNFGALGERPTHPELLDDLAVRFMEAGWSLKWLQRELVLSAAYRQTSRAATALRRADPENRLLGRMSRRRLAVEAWRDAVLAAAGRLDGSVGGRSIDPADPRGRRRTLYSRVSRLSLNPLLALFDFPDPNLHADRRVETTTPLQKLFVLNSPFMAGQARALAERLTAASGGPAGDDRRFIEMAYPLLYGRPAGAAEVRLGLAYLRAADDRVARRRQYAHVLLAANEMLFID
jgi:hypothetical protein